MFLKTIQVQTQLRSSTQSTAQFIYPRKVIKQQLFISEPSVPYSQVTISILRPPLQDLFIHRLRCTKNQQSTPLSPFSTFPKSITYTVPSTSYQKHHPSKSLPERNVKNYPSLSHHCPSTTDTNTNTSTRTTLPTHLSLSYLHSHLHPLTHSITPYFSIPSPTTNNETA